MCYCKQVGAVQHNTQRYLSVNPLIGVLQQFTLTYLLMAVLRYIVVKMGTLLASI